jgi:hypothetical protein
MLAALLAAALLAPAASAGDGVTVSATSPGRPIALDGKPAIAFLVFRPVPRAAKLKHCYIVVEGMTASRPVGAQYDVAVVSTGMDAMPNDVARAGTLSFYEDIGLPAAKAVPQSFEIPVRYCNHNSYVTLTPSGAFNPGSAPQIGRVSLVAR